MSALEYVNELKILENINNSGDFDYHCMGGGRMKITMDRYDADWPMIKEGGIRMF